MGVIMTTFYLIRHGETDYSRNDMMIFKDIGKNFAPLTNKGVDQLETTALDKRLLGCDVIISSPYTRALQSAAILSKALQKELVVESTLFEWVPNKHFATPYDSTSLAINEYNQYNGKYPDGELRDWEDNELLQNRILEVMERYLHHDKVGIVCHGMLIHSLFQDRWLDYGEIIEYEFDYTPSERYAIYDKNGNKTGRTNVMGNRREDHQYSMFVDIIIADHKGKFLMQKRSMKKRFFPGEWGNTGGCVKHYEKTIDAAIRETQEETGLSFDKTQIKFVKRIKNDNFFDMFFAQKEFDIDECTMQEDEVDELKMFRPEKMYALLKDKESPPGDEYMEVLRDIIDNHVK